MGFIEPMLLLRTNKLPESGPWLYEPKLDGYRAVAYKTATKVHLRSRNNKDFATKYSAIVEPLAALPPETMIDGEVIAVDDAGRPSFNALENYGATHSSLFYYVFDVMVLKGRDVMGEPLSVLVIQFVTIRR